jgi:hypothetical protein
LYSGRRRTLTLATCHLLAQLMKARVLIGLLIISMPCLRWDIPRSRALRGLPDESVSWKKERRVPGGVPYPQRLECLPLRQLRKDRSCGWCYATSAMRAALEMQMKAFVQCMWKMSSLLLASTAERRAAPIASEPAPNSFAWLERLQ